MKNSLLIIFLLINVLFFGYNYYQKVSFKSQILEGEVNNSLNLEKIEEGNMKEDDEKNEIDIEAKNIDGNTSLETLIHDMEDINSKELFNNMYNDFQDLENFSAYREYTSKYPELLPVIYAVKSEDIKMYQAFYGFIFDKMKEDDTFLEEIKILVGETESQGELKEEFLNIMGEHYKELISDKPSFDLRFGDGPLQIALSGDSVDDAKKNCDISSISGVDAESKEECYNYIYHYRANIENNLCENIEGKYQKEICKGYLKSQ